MNLKTLTLSFATLLLFIPLVFAQGAKADNAGQPLEITADNVLEWRRNDNQFVARGNALAKQGDVSVSASKLLADYRDGSGTDSGINIWQVTATDNVVITSADKKPMAARLFTILIPRRQ